MVARRRARCGKYGWPANHCKTRVQHETPQLGLPILQFKVWRHNALNPRAWLQTFNPTRMPSRRMRTARSSSRLLGVSASVHAGINPPRCGPADPPGVGLDTPPVRPLNFPPGCGPGDPPPQPDPSTFPLGVGLDACKACWDTPPPL